MSAPPEAHPPLAHLDELALEALATGRDDLVSDALLDHLDECAECAARVELERHGAMDASLALRRAMPELDDLDGMIAQAMLQAPDELSPAPSRRSLWWGAGMGGLAAAALAVLSLPSTASWGGVASAGGQLVSRWRGVDSRAEATGVPSLLRRMTDIGVQFKDLHTRQSSLEDIFVGLVHESNGAKGEAA